MNSDSGQINKIGSGGEASQRKGIVRHLFPLIFVVQQSLGPVPAPASLLKQRKNLLENLASITFQKVLFIDLLIEVVEDECAWHYEEGRGY